MQSIIIRLPNSLKELLSKDSFTTDELFEVLKLEENKKFFDKIKPVFIEYIGKEYPLIKHFLKNL